MREPPEMDLVQTDDNPMPPNPVSGFITTPDGFRLRYARWRTPHPPCKGTVLVLQGRAEFIEKYFETIGDLGNAGFDVCTFDWRGQGGSDRLLADAKRGYVDSFDQYSLDLDAILEQIVLPDCRPPYFILAHSFGALAALVAAPRLANRIRRMVLCAPLVRFGDIPISQERLKFLAGFMATIGLGGVYVMGGSQLHENRRFADNNLTADQRRFERGNSFARANPHLAIGGATAGWAFAACQAMEKLADPDFIGSIAIPTLLIAAGGDKVVSVRAIEELGRRMRSGKAVTIDGARHEMLQERDIVREQLFAAFNAFIPGSSPM